MVPSFDNVQWYDTDKVKEIAGSLDRDTDIVKTIDYSVEICNVSAMTDDEALLHARKVIESYGLNRYDVRNEELEKIAEATNSQYIGFEGGSINTLDKHHFIMDDRIDIYIEYRSGDVQCFIDDELVYEFAC